MCQQRARRIKEETADHQLLLAFAGADRLCMPTIAPGEKPLLPFFSDSCCRCVSNVNEGSKVHLLLPSLACLMGRVYCPELHCGNLEQLL